VVTFNDFLTENNTFRGDANEIVLGVQLAGSWDSIINSSEVKKALKVRRDALDPEEYAEEFDEQGFGKIKTVEWVGRTTSDSPNAVDLIVTFTDGKTFGVSAKSTGQGREIVYQSAGLGTIDSALKTNLVDIRNRAEQRFIDKYNLSDQPIRRKEEIRGNPIMTKKANEERSVILRNIRNTLYRKLDMLPQPKLKQFISTQLLGDNTHSLSYVQVTGHGSGKVTITNPKKNEKRTALKTQKVVMDKSGNDSITFKSGDINIARVRIKYGTVPLATPIEVSIDPWSIVRSE
jgi:hypothetical protein